MAGRVDQHISEMDEQIALPRSNGELVFESPWEARVFGLAVALSEGGVYPWHDFSQGLAAEIATAEQEGIPSSYYERWLESLGKLVIAKGLATVDEFDEWTEKQALAEHEEHHHHHGPHSH